MSELPKVLTVWFQQYVDDDGSKKYFYNASDAADYSAIWEGHEHTITEPDKLEKYVRLKDVLNWLPEAIADAHLSGTDDEDGGQQKTVDWHLADFKAHFDLVTENNYSQSKEIE